MDEALLQLMLAIIARCNVDVGLKTKLQCNQFVITCVMERHQDEPEPRNRIEYCFRDWDGNTYEEIS